MSNSNGTMDINKSPMEIAGPNSKETILNLSIQSKNLLGKVDFSSTIEQENVVDVEFVNGRYNTLIRIPNNVRIYKEDIRNIPAILDLISSITSTPPADGLPLKSFPRTTQIQIAIEFMKYHEYIKPLGEQLWITPRIRTLFNTEWWHDKFDKALINTQTKIKYEYQNNDQPTVDYDTILNSGYIDLQEFKKLEPKPGMNLLWALGIYFFDKLLRNWKEFIPAEIDPTDTIMDIDLNQGKFKKMMDAKAFFIHQLRTYLNLTPGSLFFGGGYFSNLKYHIQKKATDMNREIILEELRYFTDNMNLIYSGGNNIYRGPEDNETEPFSVTDVQYSTYNDGPNENVQLQIYLRVQADNQESQFILPVNSVLLGEM